MGYPKKCNASDLIVVKTIRLRKAKLLEWAKVTKHKFKVNLSYTIYDWAQKITERLREKNR